jgi:hypothetical protein
MKNAQSQLCIGFPNGAAVNGALLARTCGNFGGRSRILQFG